MTKIKHNCTKEGDFEFIAIAGIYSNGDIVPKDVIKCKICGREWAEKFI